MHLFNLLPFALIQSLIEVQLWKGRNSVNLFFSNQLPPFVYVTVSHKKSHEWKKIGLKYWYKGNKYIQKCILETILNEIMITPTLIEKRKWTLQSINPLTTWKPCRLDFYYLIVSTKLLFTTKTEWVSYVKGLFYWSNFSTNYNWCVYNLMFLLQQYYVTGEV